MHSSKLTVKTLFTNKNQNLVKFYRSNFNNLFQHFYEDINHIGARTYASDARSVIMQRIHIDASEVSQALKSLFMTICTNYLPICLFTCYKQI